MLQGWGALQKYKPVKEYFKVQIKKNNKKQDRAFKIWFWFSLITPFSFNNIWWWTLIISIIYTLEKYIGNLSLQAKIDPTTLTNVTADILKSLIVAIITYIATNIFKELLLIRNLYVKGAKTVEDASSRIVESKDTIIDVLKMTKAIKPFVKFEEKLEEYIEKNYRDE